MPEPRKMQPGGRTVEPSFTLIVGDTRYPIWFNEASARDVNDLRAGYRRGGLMNLQAAMASGDLDLDDVAALIWLSRRQTGEPRLDFDSVLDLVSYDTRFFIEAGVDETEDDSPEA